MFTRILSPVPVSYTHLCETAVDLLLRGDERLCGNDGLQGPFHDLPERFVLFVQQEHQPRRLRVEDVYKRQFWICALAIVTLLSVPRIGGSEHLWMNGLYDTLCAVVLFPLLVCLGASGKTTDRVTTRICKFLGDISYPLYMVHYPFIYLLSLIHICST